MREPLLTERLILRDITEADADLLFELDSDPEVMRYIGKRPAPDVAGYRDRARTVYVPLRYQNRFSAPRMDTSVTSGCFALFSVDSAST